jgi:integrase
MRPPKDRPIIGFWVSAEFTVFIGWIDQRSGRHDQALYRLAVQTGMRRGELLGLRWSNVDWTAGHVTVVEQLAQRKHGVARFGLPKTRASQRTIDLSHDTLDALRSWRELQEEQRREWAELYEGAGLVFCRENGSANDPRTVSKRFSTQAADAGVKRASASTTSATPRP